MTTAFDAYAHHRSLMQTQNYAAQPELLNDLEWRPATMGDTVYCADEEQPFVFIIVAKVSPHQLKVGTSGNYISDEYGSLKKAKYQLFLTHSLQQPFKNDFGLVYNLLSSLQDKGARTAICKDLLYNQSGSQLIRCTREVFAIRETKAIPESTKEDEDNEQSVNDTDSEPDSDVDKLTANWRVPRQFRNEMESIKKRYRAVPLPVYSNDELVKPHVLDSDLTNAIVEVGFTLHHNHIPSSKPPKDSFHAQIQQINILKKGVSTSLSLSDPVDRPTPIYKPLSKGKEPQTALGKRGRETETEIRTEKSTRKKKKITIAPKTTTNADDKGEGTSGTTERDIVADKT